MPDLTPTFPRQPMPTGQRTLVTVVTNAEPLPLEQRLRQNHSGRVLEIEISIILFVKVGGPMVRTKRHVTTVPYANNRQTQDRARKRPSKFHSTYTHLYLNDSGQKPDGSGPTTLELRKIPTESNTISKLNEHFSKFGTVTNVQVYIHSHTYSSIHSISFPLDCF